jgi:hypothetical protein
MFFPDGGLTPSHSGPEVLLWEVSPVGNEKRASHQSVASGRFGPCSSIEPIGRSAISVFAVAAANSGKVMLSIVG